MEMQLEIEDEYQQFLEDIKGSGFIFGTYMDETEYEDDYSHNSIGNAMGILEKRIREYLHKNRPDEFVVYSDWSVHVIKKRKQKKWELGKD